MAVCMGTEKPTAWVHSKAAGSHGCTLRSRQRTSCPARRSAAAGEATCNGWWPSS
jgi:hypothetical protein